MHWFIDPIKYHYADFDGRVGRQEFWMFTLFSFILYILLEVIGIDAATLLVSLALSIPSLALSARRLHDIGKSGWWQLIVLIPIIGFIVLIVWCAQKTDPSSNIYGAPAVPKSAAPETTTVAPATPVSDTTTAE
jgi:uncharacterized membrane protein YhaH (DUF805 family)